MAKHSRSSAQRGIGVLYLFKLTLLITVLMIGNSFLVGRMVRAVVGWVPEILDDVRLYQFFQIFVPIVLVCFQFWIYDRIKDFHLGSQDVSGTQDMPRNQA